MLQPRLASLLLLASAACADPSVDVLAADAESRAPVSDAGDHSALDDARGVMRDATMASYDAQPAPAAAVAPGSHAPRIMVLGDSISQGDDGDYTWRYRLWQKLQDAAVSANFVGPRTAPHSGVYALSGWDCDHDALWGHSLAAELGQTAARVTQFRPDVLIVLLGTNDLTWLARTPEDTCADMATMVADAQRADAQIVVLMSELGGAAPLTDTLARRYNACLRALTQGSSVLLAPLAGTFDASTDTYDGTHPNEQGERVIADALAAVLAADVPGFERLGALAP